MYTVVFRLQTIAPVRTDEKNHPDTFRFTSDVNNGQGDFETGAEIAASGRHGRRMMREEWFVRVTVATTLMADGGRAAVATTRLIFVKSVQEKLFVVVGGKVLPLYWYLGQRIVYLKTMTNSSRGCLCPVQHILQGRPGMTLK